MPAANIDGLYYITHIDNLESILKHGILSHRQIDERGIEYTAIYDRGIVSNRKMIKTPEGHSLWDYANLYFQPRNPMLYRVIREKGTQDIIVLKIKKTILNRNDILITDGNAASFQTQIKSLNKSELSLITKLVNKEYWNNEDGSKRQIMSECLVPNNVNPNLIDCIYVASENGAASKSREILKHAQSHLNVIVEPKMFFRSDQRYEISTSLYLMKGDMFFSRLQTLTISVNTVGVMGKGLASRAKYQFPDVYVRYEDLCRDRTLQVGKPALVKRETSIASELSDLPIEDETGTWFLLFPTKKHWKEDSKLEYIIDGLAYLKDNYAKWGITSLAMPALGCGLGGLDWAEVGPLLCTTLNTFDIPIEIYLPTEQKTPPEQLTADFLIRA